MTKSEAVKLFGSEQCKGHFEKYGRFNNKKIESSLIKTLEQNYESVKTVKQGRAYVYELGAKKEEVDEREDGRSKNGKHQIPYEYELNSLVLDYILKNCKDKVVSKSLNNWLVDIGLVDRMLTNASYGTSINTNLEKLKEEYNTIMADGEEVILFSGGDIILLENFVKTELDTLRRNLASVFHKLSKNKIIIHQKENYGCSADDNTHRKLSDLEVANVGKLKQELTKKHEISLKDLYKHKHPSVVAYRKEYNERLKSELGFRYVYESHSCVVQVSDSIIGEYIDGLVERDELVVCYGLSEMNIIVMIEEFKRCYGDRAVERAEDRQGRVVKLDQEHDNYLLIMKATGKYLEMWKLLLEFYGLSEKKLKISA